MDIISKGKDALLYVCVLFQLIWLRVVASWPIFWEVGFPLGALGVEGGSLHPLVFHRLPGWSQFQYYIESGFRYLVKILYEYILTLLIS